MARPFLLFAVAVTLAFPDKNAAADLAPFLLATATITALPDNVALPFLFIQTATKFALPLNNTDESFIRTAVAVTTALPLSAPVAIFTRSAVAVIDALPLIPTNANLVLTGGFTVTWPRPAASASATFVTGVIANAVAVIAALADRDDLAVLFLAVAVTVALQLSEPVAGFTL